MTGHIVGRQRWLPRWVHRTYAIGLGYFWTPCEDCGKWWGGHEWIYQGQTRPVDRWSGVAAWCPECGLSERHPTYSDDGVRVRGQRRREEQ